MATKTKKTTDKYKPNQFVVHPHHGAAKVVRKVNKNVEVLFINFGKKEALFSLKAIKALREAGVNAELYPDTAKMKKQMTHANRRNIPFVVLVGEQEITSNTYTLKDMISGEQSKVSLEELISKVK